MRNFTWNQFPTKNLLIDSLLTPIVESTHLQVPQIQKITSKKWTRTWNASRMTTFQGQSAKRRSKN